MSAETRSRTDDGAARRLVLACLAIGAGGLLLGLQRHADGPLIGTGYAGLGMGTFVALVALLANATAEVRAGHGITMPRDGLALLSVAAGFCGAAFLVAGVLVPGGPWMFAEALVLLVVFARSSGPETGSDAGDGPRVGRGTLFLLGAMLLFRLWVTHQGCERQWAAVQIDVPLLSGLSWLPDSLRTISLVEFTAAEFGIPAAGLVFSHTLALWALGFALAAGGMWLRQRSSWEYENDRVHATISELPPALASLVERLIPEEDWRREGLHHLSDRQRRKRISALTEERVRRQIELREAFHAATGAGAGEARTEFAREVFGAIDRQGALPGPRARDRDEEA